MKKHILLLLLLAITFTVQAQTKAIYAFNQPGQAEQFQKLTSDLRCLVCQNQSLADSNAALAADLRHLIAQKVIAGESSVAIIDYLVARYGEFILYKPPLNSKTYILWLGPFALLGLILGIILINNRNRSRPSL